MAKEKYLALDDLQTVWDDSIKPVIAMKSDISNFLVDVTQEEFNNIFN